MVKKIKPVPPDEHCNARTRAGTLCKKKAGAGTDHLGEGRCKLHGGVVGKNHGPPKGSQNAKQHGIYARLFKQDELDAAAEMAGSVDTELAIARLQLANLIQKIQADEFELKKLEVKTIGMESPEQHAAKVKEARAKDAAMCGEYYDPDDDDHGLEQESQPVEIKRVREKPDWNAEFIRLTSLVAKLEAQRQSMQQREQIISRLKAIAKGDGQNGDDDFSHLSDQELNTLFSKLIEG